MMAFAGAFTTKQQLMHPHCFVYYMTKLDEDSFDMLYKNYCWAAILDPIWTTNVPILYERIKNMVSSTDNNFMICFFDFERFSIESRFFFFFFFLVHTVYLFHSKFCDIASVEFPCHMALMLLRIAKLDWKKRMPKRNAWVTWWKFRLYTEHFVASRPECKKNYVVRASLLGNNQDSMKYSKFYETIGNKVVFLLSYCNRLSKFNKIY